MTQILNFQDNSYRCIVFISRQSWGSDIDEEAAKKSGGGLCNLTGRER